MNQDFLKIRRFEMKNYYCLLLSFCFLSSLVGQEKVHQTFKDTRVINSHSVETLRKGILDLRIAHRFGDVDGGWPSFFGLETASDVFIGLEYGVSDILMIGFSRTKGSGPLRQNINGLIKCNILSQDINGTNPFSLTVLGTMSYSTMQKSPIPSDLNFFSKSAHRASYHLEFMIASKLSDRLAFQVAGAWTYRNIVESGDKNDLPSVAGILKYQFSKVFGLIIEAAIPFSEFRNNETNFDDSKRFHYPIGIGFEWETGGGHVFQLNLTNASGIVETDYIPYTTSSWSDGGYRLGFTISRQFKL